MSDIITGRKVKLRKAEPEDAELLCKWYADGRVMIHVGFPDGMQESADRLRKRLANLENENSLFIILDELNYPIGECNFKNKNYVSCGIGIKICELTYQGKGYGQDALRTFINYLFTTYELKQIYLDTLLENNRAQNLYKKIGFKVIGINNDCWIDPMGRSRSAVDMILTRDEFFKNNLIKKRN